MIFLCIKISLYYLNIFTTFLNTTLISIMIHSVCNRRDSMDVVVTIIGIIGVVVLMYLTVVLLKGDKQ